MSLKLLFEKITETLHLGTLVATPARVTGGLMHRMYKLETTTGTYAVKLLNPTIIKRPDALGNFQRAERLESVLQQNNIPCVPALKIDGKKMHCIDGQYLYVFHWINGKAILWENLTKWHCETAGALLAKVHRIQQSDVPSEIDEIHVDWDGYITQAKENCPEIATELAKHRHLFYSAQDQYNQALQNMPSITTICNGDMDCKNILWEDDHPLMIDLECLDYGNPYWEMFRLALDWSGDVLCKINFEHLQAFLTAYRQEFHKPSDTATSSHTSSSITPDMDLSSLYGIGFGWLDWLDYNIKRALMLECGDEEERHLGIEQVLTTIPRIVYYDSIREELLTHLPNKL